ncbi:hypothetical protein [Natronosalvus vescus]|uniref:hypothetical protein n=1 Tax=Natronosalvus vescus TaxID=2953881 RepID=UPI002090876B|nr:hypothetical protein [Natronosalvus vescus]
MNHYLDNTDLDVADASLEPETVAVGESVSVTFGVATFGGEAAFTAGLLVDGEAVDTREGTIDGGADCVGFSGSEYEFTRAFDEPGEYDLAGQIEVDESLSAGDRESIGTVTVTE